jgi:outer membrane immunogenic protein
MKRTLLCAAALLSLSSLGYAADLPSRALAPAPVYLAPAFTWTGFYVGGNVGAAWSGRDNCPLGHTIHEGVYTLDSGFTPNCNSDRSTHFIGGLQAGYNWQFGSWLLGLEGDINWIGRNNKRGYDYATFDQDGGRVYNWSGNGGSNTLGTIRARLGVTMDRALLYVTGGVAFRNGDDDASVTVTGYDTNHRPRERGGDDHRPDVKIYSGSGNGDKTGWALGGGLEYALTENLSTKIEYLHAQFGNGGGLYSSAEDDCYGFRGDRKNSIDIVRVGLNYRFVSAAPAPVLARY